MYDVNSRPVWILIIYANVRVLVLQMLLVLLYALLSITGNGSEIVLTCVGVGIPLAVVPEAAKLGIWFQPAWLYGLLASSGTQIYITIALFWAEPLPPPVRLVIWWLSIIIGVGVWGSLSAEIAARWDRTIVK